MSPDAERKRKVGKDKIQKRSWPAVSTVSRHQRWEMPPLKQCEDARVATAFAAYPKEMRTRLKKGAR